MITILPTLIKAAQSAEKLLPMQQYWVVASLKVIPKEGKDSETLFVFSIKQRYYTTYAYLIGRRFSATLGEGEDKPTRTSQELHSARMKTSICYMPHPSAQSQQLRLERRLCNQL